MMHCHFISLIPMVVSLVIAPLMLSVINKVKAGFAGRVGPPMLQPYYDIVKLVQKGAVYSNSTTWMFKAGPVMSLAGTLTALLLIPMGAFPAVIAFPGDFILAAYLLGLGRFFTVSAALDTGSSFEGMGASREVTYSALAEPALFFGLAALARITGNISLSGMFAGLTVSVWTAAAPAIMLAAVGLFVIVLAENARIPVDDPNTHLELTMIHEVMVLDHSGPEFAAILYGAAMKLWLMGAILVGILLPFHSGSRMLTLLAYVSGMMSLAVLIGIVESIMARLRLVRVPQLLVGAAGLCSLALILVVR